MQARSRTGKLKALKARAAEQPMVHDEDHSGADGRDDHAIEIQSGHAAHSGDVEEPAADKRSADPKKNVQNEPFSGSIDDFAGNEAGNEPKDDPRDN
jgi:hypothetical protein